MGYYIRALTDKKKFPKWKVQFISYKKADAENPAVPKPKKVWGRTERSLACSWLSDTHEGKRSASSGQATQ